MRTFLIFLAVLLLAFTGYAYYRDPAGCEKLLNDTGSIATSGFEKLLNDAGPVVTSLSPVALQPAVASPIAPLFEGKLILADGSPFTFPANAPAAIQYYAIYYSAQWCPPCHAFTPVLVEWYKNFKPTHPNFELIFVSEDRNEAAMLAYMKEMAMPWPAVRYSDLKHDGNGTFKGSGIEKFAGGGIPDLVLVDADGKVLSDSFASTGSYLGPRHVLDDMGKLVIAGAPAPGQPTAAAPAPASAPAASNPPTPPIKTWSPPAVMPAQPNWTWTTLDGKTYQNVVVTKIEPETVSITHSMGAAHDIPINLLPPDIQKQLNYDPVAAAAARAESQRELAHPYYNFTSLAEAQSMARQLRRPLAWMCAYRTALDTINPPPGSEDDATQMALNHLKSQAVVIFLDSTDFPALSPMIRDQQFYQFDDGPMPGGHHFYAPKIVFSDADVTKVLGRVSYTQMKASGALAIDEVLASLPKDSDAQSPSNGQIASAPTPPVSSPTAAPVPAAPAPTVAPSAAPVTAATPPSTPPVATPSPDANKPWAPPDVMPSQPNWTWTTAEGKTYQDVVVTKIEPDTVSIMHSMGAAHIPINLLPPDIQKQLNYDPHAASQLFALINGKLVSADGTAASMPGPSVQYYAIYYSAQWCPPCHAFTPRLVKWYNAFKPAHPNFELIFVSEDHNEASMFDYMKEMTMPWPAVRFNDLQHDGRGTFKGSGIEKFAGNGIPDLVLVDTSGKVLSDSYQSGTYVGPETVVDDINKFLGGASPVPLARQAPSAPASRPVLISAQD